MDAPFTVSRRRLKEIAALAGRKHRESSGQFLVEGVRSVESAVAAGAPVVELLLGATVRGEARVEALVRNTEAPAYVLPEGELAKLSDAETSQGVLAVCRIPLVEADVLPRCRTVLVLDGVQDPGNAGALLRSAAWFGADAVVTGPGTVDLFNPKTVRAAMGGLWDLRLVRSDDLARTLGTLRDHGFTCYGADLDGTPAGRWTPASPSALVLGSEAHGLSPDVRRVLASYVSIPGAAGRRGVESLNVAVAAGILLYEWLGK